VGESRARLSRIATLGVPAHVTVLFPFLTPSLIDDAVLDRVGDVSAEVSHFDYRFSTTGWFEDEVLYLAPDDPGPFAALTERLAAAFPDHPPYRGEIDDLVPHLTVGERADVAEMRVAEDTVREHLPVEGRAHRLTLIGEDATGQWAPMGWFPLGGVGGFASA
jgi:2'-5' RNA ligase